MLRVGSQLAFFAVELDLTPRLQCSWHIGVLLFETRRELLQLDLLDGRKVCLLASAISAARVVEESAERWSVLGLNFLLLIGIILVFRSLHDFVA